MSKPQTLTKEQSQLLLEALLCSNGTPKQRHRGIRNHTIALVMLDAGLRVGELVQLNKSSLWFNNQPVTSILVPARIAHSSTERYVPLTERLSVAVEDMQLHHWSMFSPSVDHPAFYSVQPSRTLSERQVQRIINAGSLNAFGRTINPHSLRHTFGTRLMRITNARIVQVLLGHKHLASTQIYTHPNQQDLTTAIASLDRAEESADTT
ncbi:Tyrosine recombinase XerC [subsurface metagenome]